MATFPISVPCCLFLVPSEDAYIEHVEACGIMRQMAFNQGVARDRLNYMPVPRCDRCRFWGGAGAVYGTGVCTHPRDLLTRDGAPHEPGNVWTSPDFGCVQFKTKP